MKKPIVKRALGSIGKAALKRRLAQEVKDRAAEKAARSAATKAANKKKAALAKRRDAAQAKRDAAAKQAKIKKTGKIGAGVAVGAGSLYGAGKIFGESKDKKPKPVAPARPKVRDTAGTGIPTGSELRKVARKKKAAIGQKAAEKYYRGEKPKKKEPRTIAEAKKMGKSYFINKAGKKLAAVTKEDLKKSGLSLRAYLNKQKGLTRRGPVTPLTSAAAKKDYQGYDMHGLVPKASSPGAAKRVAPVKKPSVARRPNGVGDAGVAQKMADINVAKKAKMKQAAAHIEEREAGRKKPKKSTSGFKQISGKTDWSAGPKEYETPFGNVKVDSTPYEETLEPWEREMLEASYKKGGKVGKKKGGKVGKKKQGYKKARKDESIAMRVKKKRTKKQLKASRDESYGKKGRGKINRNSGSALVASSYD